MVGMTALHQDLMPLRFPAALFLQKPYLPAEPCALRWATLSFPSSLVHDAQAAFNLLK